MGNISYAGDSAKPEPSFVPKKQNSSQERRKKYEGIMPISFFARSEEGARSLQALMVVIRPHSWQGGS